jgi:osmotically-inducible protein OsmY
MTHGWKNVRWLCVVLVLSAVGCSKSDPDTLAAIGHKLADRTSSVSENLQQTWIQFTGRLLLESRVKTRLHWDKSLAEASIEVHATDKSVQLKGTLPSQELVRRAVELAESTLGVDKVVNSLQVDKP